MKTYPKKCLYTIGYGRWTPNRRLEQLLHALQASKINTLIDIRHSPCPANPDPRSNYGPRPWHLLDAAQGLDGHLRSVGIAYQWLVELGNPQKTDPDMTVLRSHLATPDAPWPVNRGLARLYEIVQANGNHCALLCACKYYDNCHRKLIAEVFSQRFFEGGLTIL